MSERDLQMEGMLDTNRDEIERHVESLAEVQRELKEVAAGKSFLLVDSLAGGWRLPGRGLEKLEQMGGAYKKLAKIYLDHLFGGKLPQSVGDMFQAFLGDVKLQTHRITDSSSFQGDKVSAIIMSGSPADISKAFDERYQAKEIRANAGITHRRTFEVTGELYREAAKQNLPVIGICYGHQRIAAEQGNDVIRIPGREEEGVSNVESTEYGDGLLAGVMGEVEPLRGQVAAYHGDEVIANSDRSAVVLQTSDAESPIIHGMLHAGQGAFTGDAGADSALIHSLLEDDKHVALTVQSHPEETGAERIITFAIKEDPAIFEETRGKIITADMLRIFTNFLALNKNFNRQDK